MVNKVILIGRATADPEIRTTAAGTAVANVRLVTNSYSGKDVHGIYADELEGKRAEDEFEARDDGSRSKTLLIRWRSAKL